MPSAGGGGDASEERCEVFAIAEHIASERIVSSMNDRRLLQSRCFSTGYHRKSTMIV